MKNALNTLFIVHIYKPFIKRTVIKSDKQKKKIWWLEITAISLVKV